MENTLKTTSQPWWRTETYDNKIYVPPSFTELAGPMGLALVKVWPQADGEVKTDKGWGLQGPKGEEDRGFMPRYLDQDFTPRRALHSYEKDLSAFAFVMRAVRLVCIDIDGKNGGFEHAKKLGALPPTLAETSKSGNGYHLFYEVDDTWDVEKGYDSYNDAIGIEQGVDIRGTGCVYHYKSQRWNGRAPAMLPDHLAQSILARRQKHVAAASRIAAVKASGDPIEQLMLEDELIGDLKKPIAAGKRNTTLFAIGQKMKAAGVDAWEQHVSDRAVQVGLDGDEVGQLIRNIQRYN